MFNLIALASTTLFLIFLGPLLVSLFLLYEYRKTKQRTGDEAAKKQMQKNIPYIGAVALLWVLLLGSGRDYLKDIIANEPVSATGTVTNVKEMKKSRRRSIYEVEVLTADGTILQLRIAPSCVEDYQLVTDALYRVSYYPQSLALCEADMIKSTADYRLP